MKPGDHRALTPFTAVTLTGNQSRKTNCLRFSHIQQIIPFFTSTWQSAMAAPFASHASLHGPTRLTRLPRDASSGDAARGVSFG